MCREPSEGASNPASSRRRVVFPHPLGPRREKNSPAATSSDTPSTAVKSRPPAPAKRLVTPRISTRGEGGIQVSRRERSLPPAGESVSVPPCRVRLREEELVDRLGHVVRLVGLGKPLVHVDRGAEPVAARRERRRDRQPQP